MTVIPSLVGLGRRWSPVVALLLVLALLLWRLAEIQENHLPVGNEPLPETDQPSPEAGTGQDSPSARENPSPTSLATRVTPLSEEGRLFELLVKTGLVASQGSLLLIPTTDPLADRHRRLTEPDSAVGRLSNEAWEQRQQTLKALEHSQAGRRVRSEIDLWNRQHRLVAIRDNLPGTSQHWNVAQNENGEILPISMDRLHAWIPLTYGFIHDKVLRPGFQAWTAAAVMGERVRFSRRITLSEPQEVTIQVVGRKLHWISPDRPVVVTPRCDERRAAALPCDRENAPAQVISLSLPAGTQEMVLETTPLDDSASTVPGVAIRRLEDGRFSWRDLGRSRKEGRGSAQLLLVNEGKSEALTDDQGMPTALAWEVGLIPVTGVGPEHAYSLTGVLARSPLPAGIHRITLTLEGEAQTIASQVLTTKLEAFQERWRKENKSREATFAPRRKAAVVLLDATSGAILAVAGYPHIPRNMEPWDLLSYEKLHPTRNPLLIPAWRGLDLQNTPGSTFKPLVAMAAMQANRNDMEAYLQGYPATTFTKETGLKETSASYHPSDINAFNRPNPCQERDRARGVPVARIHNYKGYPLNHGWDGQSLLGLRFAVFKSVNVWFAHLAVRMDGAPLYDFDARTCANSAPLPEEFPDLQLLKTARALGFGQGPIDLGRGLASALRLRRFLPRAGGTWDTEALLAPNPECKKLTPPRLPLEGDLLFAATGQMDLMDRCAQGDRLFVLAQSGMGHAVLASPLQMARVAATVATGRIPQPFLFQNLEEKPLASDLPQDLGVDEKKLALLRESMAKVPQPGGTAGSTFASKGQCDDLCARVRGKTGTAHHAESGTNTVWFMGWVEPGKFRNAPVAFACMVGHAHGSLDAGGDVCAPIIREILSRLDTPSAPVGPVQKEKRP